MWGGNRTGEISREEYVKWIKKATNTKRKNIFAKLNKREIVQLKEMIESAMYQAVEEYKKGELREGE